MLNIPDMAAWDPREVTDWFDTIAPSVTDTEYARAQRAVTVALLGEDIAARIHHSLPRTEPCPACSAESAYCRELDRYVHEDGSSNRACWLAVSRGETTGQAPRAALPPWCGTCGLDLATTADGDKPAAMYNPRFRLIDDKPCPACHPTAAA